MWILFREKFPPCIACPCACGAHCRQIPRTPPVLCIEGVERLNIRTAPPGSRHFVQHGSEESGVFSIDRRDLYAALAGERFLQAERGVNAAETAA